MKRLLAGLLALLVVSAAAWFVLRRERQQQRAQRTESRLLQFDDREVSGLEIRREGRDWLFEQRDGRWYVTEPVDDLASAAGVRRLLSVVQQATVIETVEQTEDLAAYGLDPPLQSLQVVGPAVPALHLGDVTPLGDGVFARVEGRPGVLVLGRVEAETLRTPPEGLRDRSLTGLLGSEVIAVELRRGGASLRLERVDQTWWLTEPTRLPASIPAVDGLLGALDESPVVGFLDGVDEADPRFGLDSADTLRVTLQTSVARREVRIGAAVSEEARFAWRDDRPPVLAVLAEPLDAVVVDERRMASGTLTPFNRYRVTRFDYRVGADTLSAARDEGDVWVGEDGRRLDEGAVYGLLVGLLEARISGWIAAEGEPAGEATASLTFTLESGQGDRIEFFPDRRARVESLPHVLYRLPADPPAIPAGLRR